MNETFLRSTHKKKARVGLIAPDTMERECLASVVRNCPDVEWTGVWDDPSSALAGPSDGSPETLIVYGLEHLPPSDKSHKADKGPSIIVILRGHDIEQAREALDRGACGCITERENQETLFRAIKAVIRGDTYMSDPIRKIFLKRMLSSEPRPGRGLRAATTTLSAREAEIFHHIGHGKKTSDIAVELTLSIKTVQAYCARVKEKRGFATLHELQVAATRRAT